MTIPKAYQAYSDAERVAQDTYVKYWFDRFAAEQIVFHPTNFDCDFNDYHLEVWCSPRIRNGIHIDIRRTSPSSPNPYPHGQWLAVTKIKSESGFKKFIRRVHLKYWQ